MRKVFALLALSLSLSVPVRAEVITSGTWHTAPSASNLGNAPWSYESDDCQTCNAGYYFHIDPTWEYLDGAFAYAPEADGPVWTFEDGWTAYTHRSIAQKSNGAFTYLNLDTNEYFESDGEGWRQIILLRQVLEDVTNYRVIGEDLNLLMVTALDNKETLEKKDFNDWTLVASVRNVVVTGGGGSVPEPASMALFGLGLLVAVSRRKREH